MKKSGKILIVLSLVLAGFLLVDYASRFFLSSGSPVQKKYPVEIYRKAKPYIMFGGAPFGVEGKERLNLSGYRENIRRRSRSPGNSGFLCWGPPRWLTENRQYLSFWKTNSGKAVLIT